MRLVTNQEKKQLNKQQKEAVEHGCGPLLIIAGAGTGKTTVITERIKWLVATGKAKPAEILALTFTDKAAREMEERVDIAMPYGYTDMWISTFHSFCDRVLRQEAIQIGLDPGYRLMTGAETTKFLIDHLFEFKLNYFRPLGNPTKFVGGLLQHFSRLKDEDVSPGQYVDWIEGQKSKIKNQKSKLQIAKQEFSKFMELAAAYQRYEKLKSKKSVMDYADLISQSLSLFRRRKNVLAKYQERFKYFLVDEYQDTNIAQNELVMLLAGRKPNLTVVADDDQSIYKWRGAAVANVIRFRENYPTAKMVVLTKNYRSCQMILDQAYRLIQCNNPDRLEVKEKIDKKLRAVRSAVGEPVEFLSADRVENEAEMVVKKIKELAGKKDSAFRYGDIAILVRANNHADPFIRALGRAGIPYQFLGPGKLFRQEEVKDLIAYLMLLDYFEDNVVAYRVLSMGHFDLPARDLAAINNYARKTNLSLMESCERVEKINISTNTREKIKWLIKMFHRHLKLVPKETAGQILYCFLEDSGLLRQMADYQSAAEERKVQNISKFFDRLKTFETDHEDASVKAVVDWINLSMDLGESPLAGNLDWANENRVNLLTIHSAKGLEFPVVFLVNLVSARFPTRQLREQIPIPDELIKEALPAGDFHLQEERRLFYVGMTRAEDRLFLTAANYYGEGKREKKISPFVFEALGENAVNKVKEIAGQEQTEQLTILDWPKQANEEMLSESRTSKQVTYLSYSQIDTFTTCPRQYRFKYIQMIPVPAGAAAAFGSSMHGALRDLYRLVQAGQRPKKKDLARLLDINWVTEGYSSKAYEQKRKKQGKRMLADFFQKVYDHGQVPKDLEQSFVIRISPKLRVGGRIDRVDEKKNRLEIIDYKTGKTDDQRTVDRSLQMTIYALAATDKGIYGRRPEEVVLSFYFLDEGIVRSTFRTAEQLVSTKKEIVKKAARIESSRFQPTPGLWCNFCDFKLLCEAWS